MIPLSVGFIGSGRRASRHGNCVQTFGQRVQAVADEEPTARQEFADRFDADATFKRYEEMLAAQDLDVVMIDAPNAEHADCAVAALQEGTSVVIEKPLAHEYEAARRIQRAEAASDATLLVGFARTFDPDVRTLAAYLDDARLGDVYEVNVEFVRRRGIPQLGGWFTEEDAAGGGVVIDMGPNVLHLAMRILGFPDVETISASTGANFGVKDEEYTYLDMWGGEPVEDGTFDVEDTMRAFVRTADGTTINVKCAWASNSDPRRFVEVLGDEGGATLTPEEGLTVHTTAYGTLADHEIETDDHDPTAANWEYFIDVLRGERDHDANTVAEGVTVQRLIDAIYESAAERREIEFDTTSGPDSDDHDGGDGAADELGDGESARADG